MNPIVAQLLTFGAVAGANDLPVRRPRRPRDRDLAPLLEQERRIAAAEAKRARRRARRLAQRSES